MKRREFSTFVVGGGGGGGGALGAVENEDFGHIEDLVVSYTSRILGSR